MNKISVEETLSLTEALLTRVHKGDYTIWFEHLSAKSIWVGTGEDMYFGKDNIIAHFSRLEGSVDSNILKSTYYPMPLSATTCMVIANLILDSEDTHQAHVLYSLIYKLERDSIKLIYQHSSFEIKQTDIEMNEKIPFELRSSDFIKNLLTNVPQKHRIPVYYGSDVFYVDTQTILYLKSNDHYTDVVCIDKTIPCTSSMQKMIKLLPPDFYQIHRSYVINTQYLTHIERFHADLVSDIKLPIPPRNYMKVKKDLEKYFL